jgi:hypothetical protein
MEQEKRIERMRRCGNDYHEMGQFFRTLRHDISCKTGLLALANAIASEKEIVIDRSAKRSKECLTCWFCENAKEILDTANLERWLIACSFNRTTERKSREEHAEEPSDLGQGNDLIWDEEDFWRSVSPPGAFWDGDFE